MDKIIFQLHKAFDFINHKHYDNKLISPIITVQQDIKHKEYLGWCSGVPMWTFKSDIIENKHFEINITPQLLGETDYKEIIEIMYHETVHLSNSQKGIDDCSSRGNHKEPFKIEAERLGLIVDNVPRQGWCQTSLSEKLIQEIDEMELDISVFNLKPIIFKEKEKISKPRDPVFKYVCSHCGTEIKSKRDELQIMCEHCKTRFTRIDK